jgi:hypothetical protein
MVTMSQKHSTNQMPQSVPWALIPDTPGNSPRTRLRYPITMLNTKHYSLI